MLTMDIIQMLKEDKIKEAINLLAEEVECLKEGRE